MKKISPVRLANKDLIDPTAWMVPYGNLMTILLIFFLVLYAYAYFSSARYEKALQRMRKDVTKDLINKPEDTDLAEKLQKQLEKFATVEIDAQKIKVSLPSPVLFDSGQAELKEEAIPALHEIGQTLKNVSNKIIVEGHTDNVPVTGGKYRSNWELSSARAFSVIDYLVKNEQIDAARCAAYGYGEFHPVAPNTTEAGRARNRRIEITILRE